MNKIKLYLDFDGVILDTIRISYNMLDKLNLQNYDEIQEFYKNLDWVYLLKVSPVLNDSINCIKKLLKSNKYDISILTHVNSEAEAMEKIKFIDKELKGLEVIPCPKQIDKCNHVNPINCILVDDFIGNLDKWKEKGGIAVKYSDNNKENNFITITKLDQLLDIDFNIILKKNINSKKRVKLNNKIPN